jgi:hypothetical protein
MKLPGRILVPLALALASLAPAQAASQPVQVSVATNSATVRVGSATAPLADLSLRFDDASNLSASALGIRAETVSLSDPALLARLPTSLTSSPGALPLLLIAGAEATNAGVPGEQGLANFLVTVNGRAATDDEEPVAVPLPAGFAPGAAMLLALFGGYMAHQRRRASA